MQGENWSPKGEAKSLIEKRGIGHTSMSIGDVLVFKKHTIQPCTVVCDSGAKWFVLTLEAGKSPTGAEPNAQ